jgi:exopolyphosphatase/pppGpp-phosphohydrolase
MDRATLSPRPETSLQSGHRADSLGSLADWARRRLGNIDHERRVLQIAGALFDLTRDLHGLDHNGRWLLSAAALLHDVGRAVDPAEHERIGAEMILSDPSLRVSPESRRRLGYLTLYHRGPVPELACDEILGSADDPRALRRVLGLLRAADTLDGRSIDPPHLLFVRRGRRINIRCHVKDRAEKARKAFCRPKKYRLFSETIRCTIDVDVQLADG